ncbi:MAG TPA: hypothetical protein VHG28_13240 [Longimicrobiaceae bacterium]|nr:hypothetical protein [Longimicrobiaceae bacterium]
MIHRYDDGSPAGRSGVERRAVPVDPVYARRIDCSDSPRERERFGGGRGRGAPDPEANAARSSRPETQ